LDKIFSTKERIKILREIIFKTGRLSASGVVKKLRVSKAFVSKYFHILIKSKIIKKTGKNLYINTADPQTKSIKIMFNVKEVNINSFAKYNFVKAAGLYGSCVKGTNTEESDIDLWVYTKETGESRNAALVKELKNRISRVKVLILTDKNIQELIKTNKAFYHSLFFGSIVVYGEENVL